MLGYYATVISVGHSADVFEEQKKKMISPGRLTSAEYAFQTYTQTPRAILSLTSEDVQSDRRKRVLAP
jgi:hypothetical protein